MCGEYVACAVSCGVWRCVYFVGVEVGIASVQFERVDRPVGECVCVDLRVAQRARIASARECSPVSVYSYLQPLVVHVIGECAHAGWESLLVGHELVCLEVPHQLGPTVVDVDVLIADRRIPVRCQVVGHGHVQPLADAVVRVVGAVDVAAVALPAQPAHGRSESETVVESGHVQHGRQGNEQQRRQSGEVQGGAHGGRIHKVREERCDETITQQGYEECAQQGVQVRLIAVCVMVITLLGAGLVNGRCC